MTRFKSSFLIIAALFILTSCEKIDLGRELEVKLGETYRISWNLSFKVDSINDYRCPIGAECIWAGDVDLYFDFGFKEEVINLYNKDTNPFLRKGYLIEILDVEPYPSLVSNPEDIQEVIIFLKVEKQ